MERTIDGKIYRNVDVAISGNDEYLLVTVLDEKNDTLVHYSYSLAEGLGVEKIF